ncbi:bifunctional folylpolyglutamate synthase/dihydrofolate synthase [Aequorivita echinoideorum]|uniref:Dihydrofolate synthase/folylpolyglutamate synthase n=1 Tax=Aequorivita echinoideorum TaxID=1549647 RepID=A0ABS5S2U1_9FLAO|nr:folylpolyglutamate synthase/dihydrofolate synthase family protein [Aequorivita echinoideorum]MBT0607494.1 bifunctional folylpolyglutamate synthase/dihydrofolate synthase [Aequorivita echinoideorum]
MNYSETINWLFNQLPMYQRVGQSAYKADLTATINLADYLQNPERSFKSVHVAGTNGKGSTSHMLASIFQQAGYKTGLYTSPHLKDFRERIKLNGEKISEEKVLDFVNENKRYFEENKLSFFEMTVGMAFDFFRNEKVDIAIIEVGMGGRLDSTNIIIPEISVITNIGLDHTQFLGNSLAKIAVEKAGIIKRNVPVVIGETHPETKPIFVDISSEKKAPIFFAEEMDSPNYVSDLKGIYQEKNKKTVVAALKILQKNWNISEKNIADGMASVVKNTGLLGRWQILNENPKIICDTGHNKDGLKLVLKQLADESFNHLHIVMGIVSDKDLNSVLPMFPKNATYYFCKPNIPRGMDASVLASQAKIFGLNGSEYISVKSAYRTALQSARENDLVFVGGSTFVVAEVL